MYKKRDLEPLLQQELLNEKILLVVGARQTGKTTLLKQLQQQLPENTESFYWTLEDYEIKDLLNQHPSKLFELIGKAKHKRWIFIDEIQYLDNPTNFLKYLYDLHKDEIKLIVSGSSSFYIDKKFSDSLVGRKKLFTLHGLNFSEFLRFKEREDLQKKLHKQTPSPILSKELLPYYYEFINFGAYPECVLQGNITAKKEYLQEITQTFIRKDIKDAGVSEERKFIHLLKILAHQVGQLVNINELANTLDLSTTTIQKYIYTMEKSFHISLISPFFGNNIRKELTKMPKIYFFDTGLRNSLVNNFEAFDLRIDNGVILENAIFKQLTAKYQFSDIQYRRTQNKNEVDFVIEKEYQAYEAKVNIKKFSPEKYKNFQKHYPNFKLTAIDLEKSMYL